MFGIAASGAMGIAQTPPAERRSVWDGVYTEAQASRGRKEDEGACERCHKSNLGGDPVEEVPPLVWDTFMVQWSNRTVKDLVDRISGSMPPDEPGGLTRRAVRRYRVVHFAGQFVSGRKATARSRCNTTRTNCD